MADYNQERVTCKYGTGMALLKTRDYLRIMKSSPAELMGRDAEGIAIL